MRMSTINLFNGPYSFPVLDHTTLNLGGLVGGDDASIHPVVKIDVASFDTTINFVDKLGSFGAYGNGSVILLEAPAAFHATISATGGTLGEIETPNMFGVTHGTFHGEVLKLYSATGQEMESLRITGISNLQISEGGTTNMPHGGLSITSVNSPEQSSGPGYFTIHQS